MSLTINTRKLDGIVVVDITGRLTGGEGTLSLRNTIRRYTDDGSRKFILNLADVSYIDSSGLGELITIYTTVRRNEGDVKLLHLTKTAKDLLQMTKLLTVFDSFDDEKRAIDSLH